MKYIIFLPIFFLGGCFLFRMGGPAPRPIITESHYVFMNNCPMDVVLTMDFAAPIPSDYCDPFDVKSGGIGSKHLLRNVSRSTSITVKTTASEGDTSCRVLTKEELKLITYKKTSSDYSIACTSLCGEKKENIEPACSRDTGLKVRRFKFRNQ